jgi:outer membrane protein OmpA-like peptidoglycan-associated protein
MANGGQSADQPADSSSLTRRDSGREFVRPTGAEHEFRLSRMQGLLLEVEDVHFHFDSAVMMPDYGDCTASVDAADANHISGLAVLRACYLHAERMPSNQILIAGHTDRSGSDSYNLELSRKRANNVKHLLLGEREEWRNLCDAQHKTEDIQQILIWVHAQFGWPCDPGPKNNVMNPQTITAIRHFQETYNDNFDPDIAVDGDVGPETWGAFFDVYMMGLRLLLVTDDAGLAERRGRIRFLDSGGPTVGCGENHPITENTPQNYRSQIDRRVEILFFDPPQTPEFPCHPSATSCDAAQCEIYGQNRIFDFQPLPCDPAAVGVRFRVRLELGEVDRLFAPIGAQAASDPGVRQRLQALGFLHEPLNSAQITPKAQAAFDHFRTVVGAADAAAGVARLQQLVQSDIVEDGALPADGEFKQVRFPGTYCVTNADFSGGFFGNPATPAGTPHRRYALETSVWNANPNLGLVPVVAIVEQRNGSNWDPAPAGLHVHFQLVAPGTPPAASPTAANLRSTPATGSTNNSAVPPSPRTFNMTGSPDKYFRDERARNPAAAGDPQVDNAHTSVGGKRGGAVAGSNRLQNVLETGTSRAGFHDHFSFTPPTASSHPNAVTTTTNADGKAAVILMPARCGGDRYKLRAFLDPIPEPGAPQASNGGEAFAVKAETGTFVVFRNLRFSKYLRWDYPGAGVDPQHNFHFNNLGRALNAFDFPGVIATEYGRLFCQVVVEPQAQSAQAIPQAQWQAAIRFARGRVPGTTTSQSYDMAVLIPDSTATAGVNNDNAGLIRFATAAQYNAAKGSAFASAPNNLTFHTDLAGLMHAMSAEIMEFFTHNAISGLTVIQCPVMTSTEADSPFNPAGRRVLSTIGTSPGLPDNWYRSGWGGMRRGCYVTFGSGVYGGAGFPYDHNRNTMHETGHTLYCPHQYTTATQVNVGPGGSTGGIFDEHDYHDLCVMGYMSRRTTSGGGDFCGRCMLLFAGWNTHGMPANAPGP